jgi:hypothetical protein
VVEVRGKDGIAGKKEKEFLLLELQAFARLRERESI